MNLSKNVWAWENFSEQTPILFFGQNIMFLKFLKGVEEQDQNDFLKDCEPGAHAFLYILQLNMSLSLWSQ